ncbi:putative secreted protein [Xanthomonas bromi]|nr:hypothetical protein [Xanthomonas bromi]SBV53182.1 putative secreted protein [Xanthomonas bromi]
MSIPIVATPRASRTAMPMAAILLPAAFHAVDQPSPTLLDALQARSTGFRRVQSAEPLAIAEKQASAERLSLKASFGGVVRMPAAGGIAHAP